MNRYKLALTITEPLRKFDEWAEDRYMRFYFNDEGTPKYIPFKYRVFFGPQRIAERLRAIVFVWLWRNEEDWTFLRACKATVCLLLGLMFKGTKNNHYMNGYEVAYWGLNDTPKRIAKYPHGWKSIEVSSEWYQWRVALSEEWDDSGYP